RSGLGLRGEPPSAPVRKAELTEILRTPQLASAPLFETLSGEPLALRDLLAEAQARGAICVVAGEAESAPDRETRPRWVKLLGAKEIPGRLWRQQAAQGTALTAEKPSWVLWFEGPVECLRQALDGFFSDGQILEVSQGLQRLSQLQAALQAEQRQLS